MYKAYFDFNTLEKISNIPIGSQTDFELRLNNEQHKSNNQLTEKARYIIGYGRNGSGKSTISNFISNLNDEDINDSTTSMISTIDGNTYDADTINKEIGFNNIHVFNQDYINRSIFAGDNNLEAIVMIGAEAEDQRKINRLEKVRLKVEDKLVVRTGKKDEVFETIMREISQIERYYYVKATGRTNSRTQNILRTTYFEKFTNYKEVRSSNQAEENVRIPEIENLLGVLEETIALQSEEKINFDIKRIKGFNLSLALLEQVVKMDRLH